jgi:hypothetical protein
MLGQEEARHEAGQRQRHEQGAEGIDTERHDFVWPHGMVEGNRDH